MQIIDKKLNELKGYENNARTHSQEQLHDLINSIKEYGFNDPVEVDENNVILSGHARVEAAKLAGLETIPTVCHSHLSQDKKRAYTIAANKIASKAGWDLITLKTEFVDLIDAGLDLKATGFTQQEIDDLLQESIIESEDGEETEAPEPALEAISKRGDVWILGEHRLMCGDSTIIDDMNALMSGTKADMCLTSPPYNLGANSKLRGGNAGTKKPIYVDSSDSLDSDDYLDFLNSFTANILTVCDLLFLNIQCLAGNKQVIPQYWNNYRKNLVDVMIWDKLHAAPACGKRVLNSVFEFIFIFSPEENPNRHIKNGREFRGTIDNIYRLNANGKKDPLAKDHGATFPLEFASHFISNFSNKIVLDPFGGSGTTLIACEKLKRKCYTMEISPIYCDVIIKRWQKLTGKKAILESTGEAFDETSGA